MNSNTGGYVLLIHGIGTNIYKLSYTTQNYNEWFHDLKFELQDEIGVELELIYCIAVLDLPASKDYFRDFYKQYHQNNWLIFQDNIKEELIQLMKDCESIKADKVYSFFYKVGIKGERSPIISICDYLFKRQDIFLALIGTIIAITGLLQVPEVRCLAQLDACQYSQKYTIILKLFGFFGFFTSFIWFLISLSFLIDFVFIFYFLFIRTIIRKTFRFLKTLIDDFFNKAKRYSAIIILHTTLIYTAKFCRFLFWLLSNSYKIKMTFKFIYYTSIIYFSFYMSLFLAKITTTMLVQFVDALFKNAFFNLYHN